jgi:hypothetical protein
MRFLSMHTNPSHRVLDRKFGTYIVEINNRETVALEATCLAEARHLITELCFSDQAYRVYDQGDSSLGWEGETPSPTGDRTRG